MGLFLQELKRMMKSLIFVGIAVAFTIAMVSQLGVTPEALAKPNPNQSYYGHSMTDDLHYIYPQLMADLQTSVEANSFATYPYGFYREQHLEADKLATVKEIMSNIAGVPYEEIQIDGDMKLPDRATFEVQLDKIDALLGGGSAYASDAYQQHFGNKGMTYEEALADDALMRENGYDVACARYFCDYAGIFILLLSWFLGLFLWNKDRDEGIAATIYVKQISSKKLVFTRIIAMSIALLLLVWLLFTYYEIQLWLRHDLAILNPLKAYGLVTLWVFPIILFVVSLSSLLTILTHSVLFGFLGPICSMVYLMSASTNIFYHIGFGLVPRYNSVGNEAYFLSQIDTFLISRFLWIGIAIIIIIATIFIYERRRSGYHAFKN